MQDQLKNKEYNNNHNHNHDLSKISKTTMYHLPNQPLKSI